MAESGQRACQEGTGITRRKRFIQLCVRSTPPRRALGAAPAEPGKDWAVLVRKAGAAGK